VRAGQSRRRRTAQAILASRTALVTQCYLESDRHAFVTRVAVSRGHSARR
jgi:hypothetical protein